MTPGAILIGLAVLSAAALFLMRPFVKPKPARRPLSESGQLLALKERQLDEIRSLDFDYETGKIPDDIYGPQREKLVLQAAETLSRLDQLPAASADADRLAAIEAAVMRIREERINNQPAAELCAHCGHKLKVGDKFCAQCGQGVGAVPSPSTIPS